ncbi:DUF637 domain-containing protein [Pseudomonas fluorescens]|uniref:DUF637 domain-containing protein n=1 Tax=Pseudomonas fluorescens TaxID=294 RepID=UPI003D1F456D
MANLGYDPDKSAKRLGDGLYEQKLIQQAVVARTGQRFIDGQTSDAALFKYLMNNAVTSKNQLNLSLGVSLTSEQVAALTHDIVWMENATVNGEQVLVPVLYLANANNRLAANGALIQGNDVNLIAGKDLNNAGTLRASNNLSAVAGNDLVNSGLVEAGNRLDLLAGNNIVNKAGGIIAGRDVNLTALKGDVVNERTITTAKASNGYMSTSNDYANSAARIEAANDLTLQAGRDVINTGGVLQSGRDTQINAGRDVNLVSAQTDSKLAGGSSFLDEKITQLTGSLSAGRDVSVSAGRDISAIASQIDAKRDIAMSATENLTLASAADESHFYSKDRHVTEQRDHVGQIATTLTAGGNVALSAGKDLTLISSRINAGDEAYLVAGDKLELLAAQDSDYSLYDKKEKGGWGSSKTQHDEVTQVTNVGSEIKTGGDLTLASGGDQKYQAAKLESGKDITLQSGGAITFEGVKDLHDESHTKSDNNAFWVSSKGEGKTDETLRQSSLIAAGNLTIKAVDGLKIDIKHIDQKSVSQTIDAMVQADPQLAWLKDAEKRGDVDWRQVKEIHESFKYSNSGLGPASQLIIAILMSCIMGPAGLGLGGMEGAAEISLATTFTTSAISNKGNLGAAFKETFSSDSLKSAAIAGFTAGALDYADQNWFAGTNTTSAATSGVEPSTGSALQIANSSKDIVTWSNAGSAALRAGGRALISSGISTAIGGGSFGDNFNAGLLGEAGNMAMATGFNWVGDTIKFPDGSIQKVLAHALMGGLLAEATGSNFKTGAAAAGLNEALMNQLAAVAGSNNDIQLMLSQLTGVVAAAAVGGDLNKGAQIAQKATTFNYLYHHEVVEMLQEMDSKGTEEEKMAVRERYAALDSQRDQELNELCNRSPDTCRGIAHDLADDDQKLGALIAQLRADGKGDAAHLVGRYAENNLSAANAMAADVNARGAGGLTQFVADGIRTVISIVPGIGSGKVGAGIKAGDSNSGAEGTESVSTGPKVPPKLQPFTNPPQGPVIPSNWESRPGRTSGSTIYYPPGTDPTAPGSTYIRLMPSGSTPVPGLENGYWISVKNGQPINPATGGTGARGDTHVPLPPNTVPPKR